VIARATMLAVCSAAALVIAFDYGREYERTHAVRDLWTNPAGMATCVVYPDGGKRCTPESKPEPVNFTECARMCRARSRMDRVR
jgi:hypothetical protein